MQLNGKTRLQRALDHLPVDRPPCICPGGMMNMITRELMDIAGVCWPEAHTDAHMMANLAAAAYEYGCFENCGVPFCMTVEAEAMGGAVNLGSLTVEPHINDFALQSVSEWRSLPSLDFSAGRLKVVLDAIALLKDRQADVPVIGNITGPMSLAGSLVDPVTLYKELRRKPEESEAFFQFIAAQLSLFARKQIAAGADCIAVSDPSGTGEILGPKLFAKYVVPALNTICRDCRKQFPHVGVIVHICGKMHKVFEPLSEIECKALSFDAVVSLRRARSMLPGAVLMGNVSTFAIENGTPQKVAALTRHCVKSGADIVAPACGMGNASPLSNVRAMLETIRIISSGEAGVDK